MGDDASATWEDYEELRSRFPAAPAWGQTGFQGGGDVRVPSSTGTEDDAIRTVTRAGEEGSSRAGTPAR